MTKEKKELGPSHIKGDGTGLESKNIEANLGNRPNMTSTDYLIKAKSLLEDHFDHHKKGDSVISEVQTDIERALSLNQQPFFSRLLRRWTPLLYIVMSGLGQVGIIELYTRWHGSYFVSLQLYDPANVEKLSNIGFMNNPPTTMDVAAEVLVWSSLGVWAKHTYEKVQKYRTTEPDFPNDIGEYIGKMMRNITVAAIVIILLRLSKFSIFDVSLDDFSAVVGISFVLGIFGDETFELLISIKDRIVESIKS